MNPTVPGDDGSFRYYDSDYAWIEELEADPARRVAAAAQGILHDVPHYMALAKAAPGPVLDVTCGTGRVTIPMGRAGATVVGVDSSPVMLEGLRRRLEGEAAEVRARVTAVRQNVLTMDLPEKGFALATLPFNGLMVIADFDGQLAMLSRIHAHLAPGGLLALDMHNPLVLPLGAQTQPEASAPRVNRYSGNRYTKFSLSGPLAADQTQHLHGWYDETLADGTVKRTPFSFHWRPVFRYEAELMLKMTGFRIASLAGGFGGEPFTATSQKMVVLAQKV